MPGFIPAFLLRGLTGQSQKKPRFEHRGFHLKQQHEKRSYDMYFLAVLIMSFVSRNCATSTTASLSFRGASLNLRG